MKYCLTGTHSTGKSTLLAALKEVYPEAYFNDSSTRDATTKEERRLEVITDQTQRNIYHKILEKEVMLDLVSRKRNVFMDRSFIDFVAYTHAFYTRGHLSKNFRDAMVKELTKRLDYYDIVFYLPIEFEIVDDGIRSIDVELQKEVDSHIREMLSMFDSVVTLKGTLDERIAQIRNSIGR